MTNKISNKKSNETPVKADVVKLAIDLHAATAVVKVQFDGSVPKPAQTIATEKFPEWVKKLRERYPQAKFFSCYEAGPCGYVLHRKLAEMGVTNYVIAPVVMNGNRKTDKRDAAALSQKLAAYVVGNTDAFSVVCVPTPEEEQRRALLRHRDSLKRQQKAAAAKGRSNMLTAGFHVKGKWWGKKRWAQLREKFPVELRRRLDDLQELCEFLQTQLLRLEKEIEQLAVEQKMQIPRGLGVLTAMKMLAEVLNWARFRSRRAVSSYTGLCPGEYSSGGKQRQGSIDRCGNRHLRHVLVEAVWRLMIWQPDYPPLKMLREASCSRSRKRLVVAIARRLAIDLWRINTGRATAEQLGLACQNASPFPPRRRSAAADNNDTATAYNNDTADAANVVTDAYAAMPDALLTPP